MMKGNDGAGTRLRSIGKKAVLLAASAGLALSQVVAVPWVPVGVALASQSMRANLTGYGTGNGASFSYIEDRLSLDDAKFASSNDNFGFDSKTCYLARSRAATTVDERLGCVYLKGENKKGENAVSGSFTLTWENAVIDSYGKTYDLRLEVGNVKYKNPTGLKFDNGIAIMSGRYVNEWSINSKELKRAYSTNSTGTKQNVLRKRVVASGDSWLTGKVEHGESATTACSAWIRGKDDIVKLHETFYTGLRQDTRASSDANWTAGSWKPCTVGGSTSAALSLEDDAETCDDSIDNMMVGTTMQVTTKVLLAGTETPVSGGSLGMGFRDIDQQALGKASDAADAYEGGIKEYVESMRFESGFLNDDDGTGAPVIFADSDTLLQTGSGTKLQDASTFAGVKGSRTAVAGEAQQSGFTCKTNAGGATYTWAGSMCATTLFESELLADIDLNIPVTVKKVIENTGGEKKESAPGAGLFSFRVYYGTVNAGNEGTAESASSGDNPCPVKSYDADNKALDADGKRVEETNKGHSNVYAYNDAKGSATLNIGYWSLMHALGYTNKKAILAAFSGNADDLFNKPYTFTVLEKDDTSGFTSGDYTEGSTGRFVQFTLTLTSDGAGGATWKIKTSQGKEVGSDNPFAFEVAKISNRESSVYVPLVAEKRLVCPLRGVELKDITGAYAFSIACVGKPDGAGGEATPPTVSGRNPDADGGTVSFGTVRLVEKGTYVYKVTEKGDVVDVRNDGSGESGTGDSEKYITVWVGNENGKKVARVNGQLVGGEETGGGNPVVFEFENTYYPHVLMPTAGSSALWVAAGLAGVALVVAGGCAFYVRRKREA